MSKALTFLAILAVIAYAIFFVNMQHKLANAPRGSDTENSYLRQTGDPNPDSDQTSVPTTGQNSDSSSNSGSTQDTSDGN